MKMSYKMVLLFYSMRLGLNS